VCGVVAAVVPVLVAGALGLLGAVATGCEAVMGVTTMPRDRTPGVAAHARRQECV
jgi:hypothetical protein